MAEIGHSLRELYWEAFDRAIEEHQRALPLGDLVSDRWAKAQRLGFGVGTSIYDSALVLGPVAVGDNSWIGPNVVLDGSGGLEIGDFVTVSANVMIASHSSVLHMLSGGKVPIERKKTVIGSRCVIGPGALVMMGVTIGNNVVVAPHSVVSRNVKPNSIVRGHPARPIGRVEFEGDIPKLIFNIQRVADE